MRVALATLGCKVNQYDSAVIERLLGEKGWQRVAFDEQAEAYVINTCTVTDRADADGRRLARRAKRINPEARVVLTGCYAQTSPTEIAALDYVDYVVGLGRLPDLLLALAGQLANKVAVSDLRRAERVETLGIESFGGRSRAFVKVQEGCDLFCTFCIIPVARGRSRSVEPKKIIGEIELLSARGFREVVLTGVHLGGYGSDLSPTSDLAHLLEEIARRAPRLRVRISSVDPPELTERFLDAVAGNDIFCHHLHIPLQSGSDTVLQRMKRRYSTTQAAAGLAEVRRRMPEACIGTDLITGFPGESQAEFDETLDYLERVDLDYLHVFPYSRRSSTAAAKRWPELPAATVHRRAREVRDLGDRLRRRFEDRFMGTQVRALFENTRDRPTGMLKGYSNNYLPLLADGPASLMNREVTVEVVGRHEGGRLEAVPV